MIVKFTDYNNAGSVIKTSCSKEWAELEKILSSMPLYIKSSDQAGKIGNSIFNPVGTNNYIKRNLESLRWAKKPIPKKYNFLGHDVDFEKNGIILEVQFSNYPFLLNNVLRSELFYKSKTVFETNPVDLLLVITKAGLLPASNSTLYYEQAVNQLNELVKNKVIDIPIRVIGLFVQEQNPIPVKWVVYTENRYSRAVVREYDAECKFTLTKKRIKISIIKKNLVRRKE